MKPVEIVHSPEFDLVLACLRWPQEQADGVRIRTLAQQSIRWPHLLKIVQQHKVVSLFSRNLEAFAAGCIPDEPAAALRASAVTNAHICLRRIGHIVSLNRLFREQQIDLRIFKGIPLAMAAFQDPTLRDAGDIDLLIREEDLFKAQEVLLTEGYLRSEPQARLTPRRLRSYIAHQKDFSYDHPGAGTVIDLHWRLFRNPWLPANAGLEEVGEAWIDLSSERIPTLPASRLLLYLCVHGALDGWLRLKWLADIGALLHSMTPEQLRLTAEEAAASQALPEFSAAILLCQEMLGPHPAPAECLDRNDRRVARTLRFGKRLMMSNHYCPVRERIPAAQWFLNEFKLHTSLRYRLDLVLRSLFRPRVWHRFDLPDVLFPLYALLSPFEWLIFRIRARLKHTVRIKIVRAASTPRRAPITPVPFSRMMQLAPADIALLLEAGCMLTFFRIALRFLPVHRLTAWMGRHGHAPPPVAPANAAEILRRVEWSIGAVVRHAPFTFVCFPQCLAAYFMLQRRQIASTLFYGVARDTEQLKAHTWIKVGDRTVVGGEVESQFTVLTTFP